MGFGGVGLKSVTSEYIADNTIISVNVGSITGADIAYGTLGNVKIGGSRVTYGTIQTASARVGSITAARVLYGTLGNAKVGGDRITYGTIPTASARIGSYNAAQVNYGVFPTPSARVGSLTAANIKYGTLGAAKISGDRVTYGTIPTASARIGSLSAARITYGTFGAGKISGARITYGTIPTVSARIGSISASRITYGSLSQVIPKVATSSLRHSSDAVVGGTGDGDLGYRIMKTITFTNGIRGTLRFNFEIRWAAAQASTAYGKIYKNGVAIGTEYSTGSSSTDSGYVSQTEAIAVVLNPGDTLELWMRADNGLSGMYCRNFRILYDNDLSGNTGVVTNATDAGYTNNRFKVGTFTHDISVEGTQAVTGIGFKPTTVLFLALVDATSLMSVGVDDGSGSHAIQDNTAGNYGYSNGRSIFVSNGSSNSRASVLSFDSDGFTITWLKSGTPTGTATVIYLAFR